MPDQHIECPNCHHIFDAEQALVQRLERELDARYQEKLKAQQSQLATEREQLEKTKQALEAQAKAQKAQFDAQLQEALEHHKQTISKEAEESAQKAQAEKLSFLQDALKKQQQENQTLKQVEIEKLKLENQLNQAKQAHEHEMALQERKIRENLTKDIKEQAIKEAEQAHHNKQLEMERKLADQRQLIEEMQRKANQNSMQLQGDVIEEAVAERLRRQFPQDKIVDVGTGMRGADIIQHIQTPLGENIADIHYETKNTKSFSHQWIDKLKEDLRQHGGAIGVIVTEVMPKELEHFGQIEGIWICQLREVQSLSFVLREMMIREHQARETQHNRHDKMSLLYDYLTGNEFAQRVQAIVEGFSTMQDDIAKERRAMERIWKSREKQIEKVINNTIDMYGSIKGIGGTAVPEVPALHFDETQDLNMDNNDDKASKDQS